MDYTTTKAKAIEWGVSERTVQEYCRTNMIPFADKFDGVHWSIPIDAEKPLLTRHQARCFLELIDDCEDGCEPDIKSLHVTISDIKTGYDYLSYLGYCRRILWGDDCVQSISQSRVSRKGRELIEEDREEFGKGRKIKETTEGEIKAGIGLFGGQVVGARTEEWSE